MSGPTDEAVLWAIIDEGHRMLAVQYEARQGALRAAADLLKLAVAAVGGLIVVAGLLASVTVRVPVVPFAGLVLGVMLALVACGRFAHLAAGSRRLTGFMVGPDMERVVDRLLERRIDGADWAMSLLHALPAWLQENDVATKALHTQLRRTLGILSVGVGLNFMAVLYIVGGSIYA